MNKNSRSLFVIGSACLLACVPYEGGDDVETDTKDDAVASDGGTSSTNSQPTTDTSASSVGQTDGSTSTGPTTHSSAETTGAQTSSDSTGETGAAAVCGDGVVEGDEACDDDGEFTPDCDNDCTEVECGDGTFNPMAAELCDDGNAQALDGCTPDCDFTPFGVIAAGDDHTCALLEDGTMRCWGYGSGGRLGYGGSETVGDDEKPYMFDAPLSFDKPVSQVTGGYFHTCARTEGDIRCWGVGETYGQLGYGNLENIYDPEPEPPVSGGGVTLHVSTGQGHTCALLDGGVVRCWGTGFDGQLGLGIPNLVIGDDELPSDVDPVSVGGEVLQIDAGSHHVCALLVGGDVRCWGSSNFGQLGYGDTNKIGDDEPPDAVGPVSLGGPATQVTAGRDHTCALMEDGSVRCWGRGNSGQLGYGNMSWIGDDELPIDVEPVTLEGPAVHVTAGHYHTCAVLEGGDVWCWGDGEFGQLGHGSMNDALAPVGPIPLNGPAIQVVAGKQHTCVLLVGGDVQCWGSDEFGQLGNGLPDENLGDEPGEMPPPLTELVAP